MIEHVKRWKNLTDEGLAIAFGPVLDPKGVWGVAIEVSNEMEAQRLVSEDPVTKARLGHIEIYPMAPNSIARKA